MAHQGKKYKKASEGLIRTAIPVQEGISRVKERAYARFDETVDVNINLGIDAAKGDQAVRGSVVLPHGVGKKTIIVVFAKGDKVTEALGAGADYAGLEDLIQKIEGGWLDFTVAIATPDVMGAVGRVAKQLGPRGLLPNRKNNTVTFDIEAAVKDLKRGRQFFKNDKSGLIHFSIGKVSFSAQQLQDNLISFLRSLAPLKPAASKGKFLKKITISSTMGPGISVNVDEI